MNTVNILIVEDEALLALALRLDLERSGYTVCEVVTSAEAAIEKAVQERPDVVLMDISLYSDTDGIEAAEEIRTRVGTPIIYITGYTNREIRERTAATQPLGYFVKPVDFRALQQTIDSALRV